MLRSALTKFSGRLCQPGTLSVQQTRTEVILERLFAPKLMKRGEKVELTDREKAYKFVRNTRNEPAGNMDVILAWDIKGLGNRGDIVNVTKRLARNHLLKCGAAVYKTPENETLFEAEREKSKHIPRQSITGQKLVDDLAAMMLPIPMNPEVPWTLSKTHVKVACRRVGLMLSEDCIELPDEPITQPGDVKLHITVNKIDKVEVKAFVFAHNKELPIPDFHVWTDTEKDLMEVIADAYEERLKKNNILQ